MKGASNTATNVASAVCDTYVVLAGAADAGVVLVCDHAGNAFPPDYGTLGLPPTELERHIAYDIGAAGVTRAMAEVLGAPAVLSRYSRLLIDPNRGADDPTLIMRLSDGAIVPGNRHVDARERERRIAAYYTPYHTAIDATLDTCIQSGRPPILVSIHSFTHNWRGNARPWQIGILWDKDPRLARPLIAALERQGDLIVGDNEPYTGRLKGDCMWQHGTMRGLAHAIIEVRQDLIADADGQRAWGERLATVLVDVLQGEAAGGALYKIEHFGSYADGKG